MPKSNSIDWQIESVRVTTFLRDKLNPSSLETWLENVSRNLPSQVTKAPSTFSGSSRSEIGFFRIIWNANRLDVLLAPEDQQNGQTISPISDIDALYNQFVDRIPEIRELTLVDRIALGLVLTFQVPSESDGLQILLPSLEGINISDQASDFLIRVNLPCKSHAIDDLTINRLATWSVGHVEFVHIDIKRDGSQDQEITQSPTAIRFELDINTDKVVQLGADLEVVQNLLNELKTIAKDIALGGEFSLRG